MPVGGLGKNMKKLLLIIMLASFANILPQYMIMNSGNIDFVYGPQGYMGYGMQCGNIYFYNS